MRKTACSQKSGGHSYSRNKGYKIKTLLPSQELGSAELSKIACMHGVNLGITQLRLFQNKNFLRSPGRVGVEVYSYLWSCRSKPAVTGSVGSRSPAVLYYHGFK